MVAIERQREGGREEFGLGMWNWELGSKPFVGQGSQEKHLNWSSGRIRQGIARKLEIFKNYYQSRALIETLERNKGTTC